MATNLPIIKANCEKILIEKMKIIAKESDRSLSKEVTQAIREHIKKYELENGEIKID